MWISHDSEFEIIQSVLDVESMMAHGATEKRDLLKKEVYAMNSREKMERKWEHQILFNSIQILVYPQARVYQPESREFISVYFLNVWWSSPDKTGESQPTSDGPTRVQFPSFKSAGNH